VNPYNPLDLENLGLSVLTAMEAREPQPIASVGVFEGAGVYAIYYTGDFRPYELLARANAGGRFQEPIYVGKAIPSGGRKGIRVSSTTRQLSARLREHARSIVAASNLDVESFWVRHLVVEAIWIPLAENLLISEHAPVWNAMIDGFGNHDPGAGRISGVRPRWDTIHPGRPWAVKYPARTETGDAIEQEAWEYLRQRLVP
jgi:hypothetical protein